MTTYVSAGYNYGGHQTEFVAANWRGRCEEIDAALVAVGIVQTSDTGQLDFASIVTVPIAGATVGYRIYRFNDSRQGVDPLFFKLTYRNGGNTGISGFNIQTGTGSDGAGTLTGQVSSVQTAGTGFYGSSFTLTDAQNYACHTEGFLYLACGLGNSIIGYPLQTFTISRTRNLAGAFDGIGNLIWSDQTGGWNPSSLVTFTRTGASPFAGTGTTHYCIAPGARTAGENGDLLLYPHFYADPDIRQMWSQFSCHRANFTVTPTAFTAYPMYSEARTFLGCYHHPRAEFNHSDFRLMALWE